jgi:actin-related protein
MEAAKALPADSYECVDGQVMLIGDARFRWPEVLFTPAIWRDGSCVPAEFAGLHAAACDAIGACDPDMRAALLANVVVCGELSGLPGIGPRLHWEMAALLPAADASHLAVHALPGRTQQRQLAWLGGSKLAAHWTFGRVCLTAQEYAESGPAAIHRRRV